MKVGIYSGEAFPIYSVHHPDVFSRIDVPVETLIRWKSAFEQFKLIQEEIIEEMKNQGQGNNVWGMTAGRDLILN